MRRFISCWGLGPITLIVALSVASTAEGAFVMNVLQTGPDVVAAGSGTIDLRDLNLSFSPPFVRSQVTPNAAIFFGGPTTPTVAEFQIAITGPTSLGSSFTSPQSTSGSGDLVGVSGLQGALLVPNGYVSDTSLSDSATWAGQSLASLGLTPGTYVWTWGTGQNADSFTLNIGGVSGGNGASAPLPRGAFASLAAIALVGWARRRFSRPCRGGTPS
jgi:hypothetical protein